MFRYTGAEVCRSRVIRSSGEIGENIRFVTGGTLVRSHYHLCDIEFHRPAIGVSGYLVRARYVSTYDVFPRTTS